MRSQRQVFPKTKNHFWQGANRSQGVVEFAVALPVLLMLLFGILDFSLLFSGWLVTQNISRQAVRYAVTGEYNAVYCDAEHNCNSPDAQTKADAEDYARLQSIHDEAKKYLSGLMVDDALIDVVYDDQLAGRELPGYLQITVCSSRPPSVTTKGETGGTYSDCTANDLHTEDPGGPGDTVVVMVDFNHPYLTPFLNQIWPMVHLASIHQGVVEEFRVSRAINLPSGGGGLVLPTNTFTNTSTPTDTFTPSETFTPSDTPTPTNTGTATGSPTPTATVNCSLFSLTSFSQGSSGWWWRVPYISIDVQNNSNESTYIESLELDWGVYEAVEPGQALSNISYKGITLSSANDYSSPSSASGDPVNASLLPGSSGTFRFDFLNSDSGWPDNVPAESFGLTVVLGNGCVVSASAQGAPTATMTGTRTNTVPTGTPTKTFTRTNTVPTSTFTRTFTRTNTVPSNTPTRTYTPSRTPTRTNTVPTNTRTRTYTRTNTVPTRTPTRTYTRTNTVPTKTFTRTYTRTNTVPTQTSTRTYTRTNTAAITSTFTRTLPPSSTPSPSKTFCSSCSGWEPGVPTNNDSTGGGVTLAGVGFLMLIGSLLSVALGPRHKDRP